MKTAHLRILRFQLVALTAAASTLAQPAKPDEPVTLEPFTVTGDAGAKFLASEVATGSRYASAIKDIPFPVTLLDKSLMDDFLAFDFNDIATFASGFSPSEGTGRFFLRGIASRSTYKNGVRDTGLFGNAFVDRVEIIRGANAAIYGQTEPSGLRNVVTLRPRDRREVYARATVGSDDYSRFSAGASEPFARGKGAIRVDAFREDSKQRAVRFWNSRQKGVYSAGRWHLTPATRLDYSIETTKSRTPSTLTQAVIVDAATRTNLGVLGVQDVPGFPKDNYYGHTYVGSPSFNNVEVLVGDLSLSHRFNSALSARVVVNRGAGRRDDQASVALLEGLFGQRLYAQAGALCHDVDHTGTQTKLISQRLGDNQASCLVNGCLHAGRLPLNWLTRGHAAHAGGCPQGVAVSPPPWSDPTAWRPGPARRMGSRARDSAPPRRDEWKRSPAVPTARDPARGTRTPGGPAHR